MAVLLCSGCGVKIKNQRWYGDIGSQGAIYFETLSNAQGQIDKQDWDQMRVGMACTSTDTLAEVKREIEQLCSVTRCDYEKVKSALGKFQMHLNHLKVSAASERAE